MYVRTVEEAYVNKRWGHVAVRRVDVYACDECGAEHHTAYKASHACSTLTFCSKACNKLSRSSGKLAQQWKQTKLERYGVEHSSQVPGATQKMIETRIKTTGASAPSEHTSSSNAKFRATMMERHGAEYPSQAQGVKVKKLKTYRERYGVDNPLSSGSPFRDPGAAVRGGQVGYRSLVLKHGDRVLSKPEAALHVWLVDRYGYHDIEQQVPVKHGLGGRKTCWLVDFYVRSIDTYIEMDGVFWHGLDVAYGDLHPYARMVYDRDRVQDVWFVGNGKKLVRVTDQLLIQCQRSGDYASIMEKLGG